MTILQANIIKQSSGYEVFSLDNISPIGDIAFVLIDIIYVELSNEVIEIIHNKYGPTGVFSRAVFDAEFNVPELTQEELQAQY